MKSRRVTIVGLIVTATALAACSSTAKNDAADATTSTSTIPTTSPPATDPPATDPPTTPEATDPPAPTGPSLYEVVAAPTLPTGHTDPFADSGVLADGLYWTLYNGGETFTPSITVVQAFFGQECIDQAAAAGDECLNGIFVVDPPFRDIEDLPFADGVHLTVSDFATQLSHWITPDELRTIRASSPSCCAPADFSYASFAFLMTVANGQITKFEQVWTP